MAYIGRGTESISNVEVLDNLTFDGSASYTLQKSSVNFVPSSANNLLISISGVVQQGNFSVSGSTITFDTTVSGSDTCDWILHYGIGLITTVADGAITEAKLGNGAVTNAKLANSSITINGSAVSLGGSATIGGGKIGQVVNTTKTNTFSTTSGTYVDVTDLSASITPSSASSKIYVILSLFISGDTQTGNYFTNISRGATQLQETVVRLPQENQSVYRLYNVSMTDFDSPSSTSALTYKVQVKTNAGTLYVNRAGNQGGFSETSTATLTVMEVLV